VNTQASAHLTPRETEVLRLLCEGVRYKELSARLQLCTSTIGVVVSRLYAKTASGNPVQLGIWALRNGYVNQQEAQ
jgi:DNA-binding NarL/FixJ family response regulator